MQDLFRSGSLSRLRGTRGGLKEFSEKKILMKKSLESKKKFRGGDGVSWVCFGRVMDAFPLGYEW